jgi:hypothetical protein
MTKCAYCGVAANDLVLDHVVPRARGGPDSPRNLVRACVKCNSEKTDMLPSEWLTSVPPAIAAIEARVTRSIDLKIRGRRGVKKPAAAAAPTDPLVGNYFHSRGDRGQIVWQGEVVARVGDAYLVQLFSWLDGRDTNRKVVPVSVMSTWTFYADAESMRDAYSRAPQEMKS